jgi:transcriptional regulator with XRE-family HTH domain
MSQYQKKNSFSVVGPNLRALRGAHSQAEFAKFLGITNQVTYHRYENGRVPKAEVLQKIAERVGITLDELLSPLPQTIIDEFRKRDRSSQTKVLADWNNEVSAPLARAISELVNGESVKQAQAAFGFRRSTDEELLRLHEHVIRVEALAPFEIIKFYELMVAAVQHELKRRLKL